MLINVDDSFTGAGKTHWAIDRLVSSRCKALFITERVKSFDAIEHAIRMAAAGYGVEPIVRQIHAGDLEWSNSVSREIEELPSFYRDTDHVIVIATHAAMLRSNFADFQGWQIVVDEVPQLLDFEKRKTHLDAAFFQTNYHLDPLERGWSSVRLSDAGAKLTVADMQTDDSHRHLAVFHRRVMEASRPGACRLVVCNLPAWDAMSDRAVEWCWASAFSLGELEPFDRIELLGNRFRRDIGCEIAQLFDPGDIQWQALPAPKPRGFDDRPVHIHYFSEVRCASLTYFDSAKGQKVLSEIGKYLIHHMPVAHSIWTANAKGRTSKSPRDALGLPDKNYLTPRQAGSNKHKGVSSAAIIYAAKPCSSLRALLKFFRIDTTKWTQSVEHETILQFATRTSVRDPENTLPVNIWVFDREQALYLKRYFDTLDHVTAHIDMVVDGPEIPRPDRSGPKAAVRTPAEQAKYRADKRARNTAQKRKSRAKIAAKKKLLAA